MPVAMRLSVRWFEPDGLHPAKTGGNIPPQARTLPGGACGFPYCPGARLCQTEAMLVAFSVAPSGVPISGPTPHDASVHDAVAAAVKVVRDSGLPNRTSSMFTEIEG